MTHKHHCIGKCGAYVACTARIIRDDCGAHCEAEEEREPYECSDCYNERKGMEEHDDWDGESTPADGLSDDD